MKLVIIAKVVFERYCSCKNILFHRTTSVRKCRQFCNGGCHCLDKEVRYEQAPCAYVATQI